MRRRPVFYDGDQPLPDIRLYEVSWNGTTVYVYATSHAKAKGWTIPNILRALGRTRGASFAGLRCRLAEHCPPDQGAHYAEVSP